MQEELLKLIYDYAIKVKMPDYSFMEKLINIVKTYDNLDKYILEFELKDEDENDKKILGNYNGSSKKITVYQLQILKCLKDKNYNFTILERNFFNCVIFVQVILHEISHAIQYKMIESNNSSLETYILKSALANYDQEIVTEMFKHGYSINQVKIYMELQEKARKNNKKINYNIAPQERLAQINSYQKLEDILENIKNAIPMLFRYIKLMKYENLLLGYEFSKNSISSPTFKYFRDSNDLNRFSKFGWYTNDVEKLLNNLQCRYDLNERLKLGLLVQDREYDEFRRNLKKGIL